MKQSNNRKLGSIPRPPQFQPTFTVMRKRLRFQAIAAGTTTIQMNNLGDLWCVATSAVAAFQLASHVRLRKIEMWAPPSSSLVPVSVTVDWTGSTIGGFGKSTRVSDTSIGSTEPAFLRSSPPPGSQISQWMLASAINEICRLTYALGTVIDVHYDLVVRDDASVTAVQNTVAGATAGANYIRPLDSAGGGTNLPPTGYASI